MKNLILIFALICTQTTAYADTERECNNRAITFAYTRQQHPTSWESHYNNIYNRWLISMDNLDNDGGVTALVVDVDTVYLFASFVQKNIFIKNDPEIICGVETLTSPRHCTSYWEYHDLIDETYGFHRDYDHGGIRR